jgi:MFS family permease
MVEALGSFRMLRQFTAQFAIVRVPEHRSYRNLLLARLISALGTWTAFFAVRIAVFNQTHSAWWISILLFSELVPGVILGIAIGPLIDRWSRKRMMVLSDLGGAAVFGVLPFVHSPAAICALSAVAGFSAAFFRPSCYSAIPNLVREDSLIAANALMQAAENLATLMGPVLAGVGVLLLGSSTVYRINSLSFIVSALLIFRIAIRLQSKVVARIGRTHWREVRSGLSLVRNDTHLSAIFLIWSWATLAYAGINVAEIVLTTDAYGAGSPGFGLFVACSAAGILLGNVVAMSFIKRLTVYGGYRASFLVTAAGVTICAVSPGLAIGCVGAVILGVGNGIGLVCNMTLIQQVVSDDRRGQIFAVLGSLVQTFTLVGTLLAGPIIVAVGPRWMWGISAGLLVLGYVNAVVLSAVRRSREPDRLDSTLVLPPIEAGGGTPGSAFERIAMLLDEVERTRQAAEQAAISRRRSRGSGEASAPPPLP